MSSLQSHDSTFVSSVNEQGQRKMNEFMEKYYSADILNDNGKKRNKKSRSMERTEFLYEIGKSKNKMNNALREKSEESRAQREIMECTWRPKLIKLNSKMEAKIKLLTNDTKIFNRNYKKKNNSQYLNKSAREDKEVSENSFNPTVKIFPL